MQHPLPSPGAVERALEQVYSRPEYATREMIPLLRWLSDRWRDVTAAFMEIVSRLQLLERTQPVLYWVVVGWLVLSAIGILAHFASIAFQLWRSRERTLRERDPSVNSGAAARGADGWEAEAGRAAAEGRLRDAALALYQALLLRLDARGSVRYDPSKTPGDYREEVARSLEVGPLLDAFLRIFEPVAFGGRTLDGPGFERMRRLVTEGGAGG